jgi:hypothetical protein
MTSPAGPRDARGARPPGRRLGALIALRLALLLGNRLRPRRGVEAVHADDAALGADRLLQEVALHERDRRALHRDVGADPHRDADLRLRERRRVVDPVARHRDEAALALEALHHVRLLVGEHLGDDVVEAEPARHRLRRLAPDGDEDDRLPFAAQGPRALRERPERDAEVAHERPVPQRDGAAVHRPAHALAGEALEPGDARELDAARLAALDDRRSERVLAAALQRRREAEQRRLVGAGRGKHGDEPRFALGERARLVDDERVHLAHHLDRLGIPEEHAQGGARLGSGLGHGAHGNRRPGHHRRAGPGVRSHRPETSRWPGLSRFGRPKAMRTLAAQYALGCAGGNPLSRAVSVPRSA